MISTKDALKDLRLHVIEWDHLNLWKFYPMALVSSLSIKTLLYPMSVVKSRLQLQKQNNVYTGMRHAFVEILRKEGPAALYRGFFATLPQLASSFLYSTTYENVRDMIQVHTGITNASVVSALAGGFASPMAQTVFVPTDIVAQHMMVHNNAKAFGGSSKNIPVVHEVLQNDGLSGKRTLGLRVVRAVYKVEGLPGFYRGFFSSIMLYTPSTMIVWCTYYQVLEGLRWVRRKTSTVQNDSREGDINERRYFLDQAIAGCTGGVTAAVLTNPLDMLRVRLQVHRTSYSETVRRLWKFEGKRVFTKGLAPRVVNNGLHSCLFLLCYETVKKSCVLPQYKDRVVW